MLKLANNIKKRCRVAGPVTRKMVTSQKKVRRLVSTLSSSHQGVERQGARRVVKRTLNNQEGAKSMESDAKDQECANQSGRRRASREAPSGQDGAKSPESSM